MYIIIAMSILLISCGRGNETASNLADTISVFPETIKVQPIQFSSLGEKGNVIIEEGATLMIRDFTVIDVHGNVCYFPGASIDDVRFQLGPPLIDQPMFSAAYREYLALSVSDENRKIWMNEFVCLYDGLYCQYFDKEGLIYIFHINGTRFRTLRGLTVGDSLQKIIELYGPPEMETFPMRKDKFLWLPEGYDRPWKILSYDVSIDTPQPDHRYFGPGATYHFFLNEQDKVELIYATGED